MTLLAVPISGEGIDEIRRQVASALAAGADAIELRMDLISGVFTEEIGMLRRTTPQEIPFILTIRSIAEGGQWDGDDQDRVSRLIELGPFVDFIDVELELWRRSANIRQKVELALHRAEHVSQTGGREEIEFARRRKLILSRHDQTGRPTSLHNDWVEMVGEPACYAPKLVWRARTVRDNFEALELMRECPKPSIVICMGSLGTMSRVLSRKFGAFATFAALEPDRATASGQLTIAEFKERYRWDTIDASTMVYGVIGDPVAHSLSPVLHNAAFAHAGINAVYFPLEVSASYEAFKAFMVEVMARPWLGFRGFSVTIPHKENALRFVREAQGFVDPLADRLGAINTLVVGEDSRLAGYNTDSAAVTDCLNKLLVGRELRGTRALVLGAGGVARAVVGALVDAGANVTITNRTSQRAQSLAEAFSCASCSWDERSNLKADMLVNCTSVGMTPRTEESPMPVESLHAGISVFDTVYRPAETRLLRDARARECRVMDGIAMFVSQARAQFRLWTGLETSEEFIRRAVAGAVPD